MRYWIVRTSPRDTDLKSVLAPGSTDEWHTGAPPSRWRRNDRLLFWSGAPDHALLGFGVFLKETDEYSDEDKLLYRVRYLTAAAQHPVSRDELRADSVVQGSNFLKQGPTQSVLELRAEEATRMYALLVGRNPEMHVWTDLSVSAVDETIADVDAIAIEGGLSVRTHLHRERDQGIIERKKASTLKNTGRLACEVCGFDFADSYGALGSGFCEVHHLTPLSLADTPRATALEDLAVVCSNCHRIIHRSKPFLEVEDLRERLRLRAR